MRRGTDNKQIDSLPDNFITEDDASEFWDTHSITDYEKCLEPVEIEFDFKRRHFEIEIDEESFLALTATARKNDKKVKQLASEILKEKLKAA